MLHRAGLGLPKKADPAGALLMPALDIWPESGGLVFLAEASEHGLWSQPGPGALTAVPAAVQLWTSCSTCDLASFPVKRED